jgi:hypothetical protein
LAHIALQNVDALFQGEGPLPSTIILDYVYGVACYKAWSSKRGGGPDKMEAYRNKHYAEIQPLPPAPRDYIDDINVSSGSDDPNDGDYKPSPKSKRHTPTGRSGLEESMDELNMFLMYIHGITPEMSAERRQKEIEQEERAAQEASRSKVTEWMNHLDVYY